MNSEVKHGRALLRDMTAAQGVYDVDYTVHINTRTIKNIDMVASTIKTISANVRSISGYILKNGRYGLEENGKALYQLEKSGTSWNVIPGNTNE